MSSYEYTKEVYNADRLIQEIRLSSITVAFDYLTGNGSALILYFKTDLSDPEKTTLDTIVANHSGEPLPDDTISKVEVTNTAVATQSRLVYPVETLTQWLKVRPRRLAGDLYLNFIYFTTTSTGNFDAGGDTNFSMSVNEAHTKTYIDFCPTFNYEAGGGSIKLLSGLTSGYCKVKFIGAPDYPVEYGGSVEFVRNKRLGPDYVDYTNDDIDPKLMKYIAQYPGINKLRLEVTHEADAKINFEYYLMISVNL